MVPSFIYWIWITQVYHQKYLTEHAVHQPRSGPAPKNPRSGKAVFLERTRSVCGSKSTVKQKHSTTVPNGAYRMRNSSIATTDFVHSPANSVNWGISFLWFFLNEPSCAHSVNLESYPVLTVPRGHVLNDMDMRSSVLSLVST